MIRIDEWVEVLEMGSLVELENQRLKGDELVWGNQGRNFREAWVAVNFAIPFGGSHICLPKLDSKGPDFLVKRDDIDHAFQTVEVLSTNRRRGAEVWTDEPKHVSQDEMEAAFQDIPAALNRAVRNKLGKYDKNTLSLVMYFNTNAFVFEDQRPQVERWILEETKPCLTEFISVFILWGGLIFQRCINDNLTHIDLRS